MRIQQFVITTRLAATGAAILLAVSPAGVASGGRGAAQAQAIAGVTASALYCSSRPHLGDSEEAVRRALEERILSDGFESFSDLTDAYPAIRGQLQGIAEWGFDSDGLETVSLKIMALDATEEELLWELQRALGGCAMEPEEEESSWSCTVPHAELGEVWIELYTASGLAWIIISA